MTSLPLTVLADLPFMVTTVAAMTLPDTTWYVKMDVRAGMSFKRPSTKLGLRLEYVCRGQDKKDSMYVPTVPAGSLANAASVGAKTVNGPADFSVETKPAAPRAAARVLKEPAPTKIEEGESDIWMRRGMIGREERETERGSRDTSGVDNVGHLQGASKSMGVRSQR
jgi:hypothetical protein